MVWLAAHLGIINKNSLWFSFSLCSSWTPRSVILLARKSLATKGTKVAVQLPHWPFLQQRSLQNQHSFRSPPPSSVPMGTLLGPGVWIRPVWELPPAKSWVAPLPVPHRLQQLLRLSMLQRSSLLLSSMVTLSLLAFSQRPSCRLHRLSLQHVLLKQPLHLLLSAHPAAQTWARRPTKAEKVRLSRRASHLSASVRPHLATLRTSLASLCSPQRLPLTPLPVPLRYLRLRVWDQGGRTRKETRSKAASGCSRRSWSSRKSRATWIGWLGAGWKPERRGVRGGRCGCQSLLEG